jgi:hypothetical protein
MGQTLSEPVVEKVRFVPLFFFYARPQLCLAFYFAFGHSNWYSDLAREGHRSVMSPSPNVGDGAGCYATPNQICSRVCIASLDPSKERSQGTCVFV